MFGRQLAVIDSVNLVAGDENLLQIDFEIFMRLFAGRARGDRRGLVMLAGGAIDHEVGGRAVQLFDDGDIVEMRLADARARVGRGGMGVGYAHAERLDVHFLLVLVVL